MTEGERRVAIFRGMLEVYGATPTDDRVAGLVALTLDLRVELLAAAVRRAMNDPTRKNADFPPGPGVIRRHALIVRDEQHRRRELAETEARLRGPALPEVANEKCAECESPAEVVRWGRDAEGLRALAEIRAYCRRCDPGIVKAAEAAQEG